MFASWEMEDYEEFYTKHLAQIQGEVQPRILPASQQGELSIIQFHGVPVLSPLLTLERRKEMTQYRNRAVELETANHGLRRSALLTRVQKILESVQVRKVSNAGEQVSAPDNHSQKSEARNGFALLPDMSGLPKGRVSGVASVPPRSSAREHPQEENGVLTPASPILAEHPSPIPTLDLRGEEDEEASNYAVSLQSLLRKSREYMEREQGRRGARGSHKVGAARGESLSDKENEGSGGTGELCEKSQPPCRSCSPVVWDVTSPACSSTPPNQQSAGSDSDSPESISLLPRSLTGSYARLPSPEPSLSPRVHRRRPRPLSAGNIVIPHPLSACEFSPMADKGQHHTGQNPQKESLMQQAAFGEPAFCISKVLTGSSELSATQSSVPVEASPWTPHAPPSGSRRHSRSGIALQGDSVIGDVSFRRRSHTMDSVSSSSLNIAEEMGPGFQGNLPRRAPRRRSPAPLNKSYNVESPSPVLLRHHVGFPGPEEHPETTPKGRLDLELWGSRERQLNTSHPDTPGEEQGGYNNKTESSSSDVGEGTREEVLVKRQMLALEAMRRRLEEEHALQLSLLIAEQEREQESFRQEMEEQERRLRDKRVELSHPGERRVSIETEPDWRAISGSCPSATTLTQGDIHTGNISHSIGFHPQLSPGTPQPSTQSPFYLWGPHRGGCKPRIKWSQVNSPEVHQRLCKLSALAKGFLTRRMLQTEKVKHLRQTVRDTLEFIKTFKTEGSLKRGAASAQDVSLQERVLAQLRAALYDVHDIFFLMPQNERLGLLQQDRELRRERKLREMEKFKSPREKVTLSAATQKSLDRKKQMRVTEMTGPSKRTQQKPKSPPTNRILQPNQGQNAPLQGQLCRQGSLYRKGPEERVKRSDSLRKQHSLG
ncbi:centriolar coiled-coil protein of 110 kDa-like isoform X3 [Polyodon spathula]|uniref:centriolar coiled-coil protein of 110 kDa-like isoform X3 n=1 Tax=Polyodon spathula TaxID=7913 RepID=UPI001B7E824B|nr:centriolar coiled-coil protein of 110 kDa-like isoform X3 [Polyodon spathula]